MFCMCRMFCSPNALKWTAFGAFIIFFTLGSLLIACWGGFFNSYLHKELILGPDTMQYKFWLETPFDIFTEIYLFNWTNSDEIKNRNFKARFQELGPYVFKERHNRVNIVFNDNKTVSFNSMKTWKFDPEKSKGSMEDMVTIMDPIVLSMSSVMQHEHPLIKKAINYFLTNYGKTLPLTRPAQVLLFDGVEDPMIQLASKLRLKIFNIPYDKFGFFYKHNASASYEGNYTMWTGEDDIQKTGIVTAWNFMNHSKSFAGECGRIDGSTGEVWYPVQNAEKISLFASDVCGLLTLERQGSAISNGIKGNRYVATEKLLDNGTIYPENACYLTDMPSGVRNISACQYNAPAFISLPNFQMADQFYIDSIDGMNPDPDKHKIEIIIEPNFGLPVEANIAFQVNFLLAPMKEITVLKNMKKIMVPYMWMKVATVIPDDYAFLIRMALNAVAIGQWIGYSLVLISLILFLIGVYVELRIRDISIFGKSTKMLTE